MHNLLKHKVQFKIVKSPKIQWKVEVNLVFASHSSREYREAMENDDEDVRIFYFIDFGLSNKILL